MHERALVAALDDALQRSRDGNREHLEQHVLVATERERRGVHDLQVLDDRFVERELVVALRGGILVRVGGVDAVDLGRLEHDVDAHLASPQRGRGIGREERVAGAGREDHDLALLEVAQRLAADVGLGDLIGAQRRLHARFHALSPQRVLQRERVHERGEHPHVVGGCTVHASSSRSDAPEDVAPADDDRHLDTEPYDLRDLGDDAIDHLAVDPVGVGAHQRLAGQLEQDALVRGRARRRRHGGDERRDDSRRVHLGASGSGFAATVTAPPDSRAQALAIAATSAAKSSFFFSIPSPTT